jgi:hypothetical protein
MINRNIPLFSMVKRKKIKKKVRKKITKTMKVVVEVVVVEYLNSFV